MLVVAMSAGALWAPATASAVLTSAYDFRAGSLAASYGAEGAPNPPALTGEGTGSNVFDAGDGYVVPLPTGFPPDGWSIVALVEFDAFAGAQRIFDVSSGLSSDGLWLRDGTLEWRNGRDTALAEDPLPIGVPVLLTIVRDGDQVRVQVDGEVVMTLFAPSGSYIDPDAELRLFGTQGPAGRLHRLRVLSHGIRVAELGALGRLDEHAPTEVSVADDSPGTYFDGQTLWVGRRGLFKVRAVDDGTGPPEVADYGVAASGSPTMLPAVGATPAGKASAQAVERIVSEVDVPFDTRFLTDGEAYRFDGKVVDRVGHQTPFERAFRVDRSPPAGLTVDAPGDTTSSVPTFEGAAGTAPRDAPSVYVTVCRGTTCDDEDGDEVAYAGSFVVDGHWRTGDLMTWPETERAPVHVTLAPGTYVARATQEDWLGNASTTDAVFRVAAAQAPDPPRPPGGTAPPSSDDRRAAPPALLSPAALLARNRRSVVTALLREGLRGLTKDGKAVADVFADRPAEVVVQLYDGSPPKTVDPKARASSRGARLIGTGRRVLTAPGAAKVTVRLAKRGRALLRGKRSRRITVRTIVVPRGGRPVATTERLTLSR